VLRISLRIHHTNAGWSRVLPPAAKGCDPYAPRMCGGSFREPCGMYVHMHLLRMNVAYSTPLPISCGNTGADGGALTRGWAAAPALIGGPVRGLGGAPQSYLLSGPQIEKARTFNGSGFLFRRAKAPKAGVLSRVPVIGGACAHFTRPEECRYLVYTKRCLHTQYFSGAIRPAACAS
jgi:hypothetical protein